MNNVAQVFFAKAAGAADSAQQPFINSSKKKFFWLFLFLLVYLAVFSFAVVKSFDLILIWALVACLLLPGFLIAMRLDSAALKLFFLTLFVTQIVGVPAFVFRQATYNYAGWSGVKDFDFSLPAFFEVYLPVSAFFIAVPLAFAILRLAFSSNQKLNWSTATALEKETQVSLLPPILFTLALISCIALHAWMFQYRVGMVGVVPPRLPFHMSGILSYTTRFVLPFLIIYFFAKSSRSLYLMVILLVYAFIFGLSQLSRSASIFIILPVALFALMDKKPIIVVVTAVWSAICIQMATSMRDVVYEGRPLRSGDAFSLWDSGWQLLSDMKFSVDFFTTVPIAILNRIESPQNLVLGHQFNADAVGGISRVLLNLFSEGLGNIDGRAYTLEWCGMLISEEYGFRGGLLSNVVISAAAGVMPLLISILYVSVYLFVFEWLARRVAIRVQSNAAYWAVSIVGTLLLLLAVGTSVFWGFVFFCLVLAVAPRLDFSLSPKLPTVFA